MYQSTPCLKLFLTGCNLETANFIANNYYFFGLCVNRFTCLCWADNQTHFTFARLVEAATFRPDTRLSVQRVYSDTDDSLLTPMGSHAPRLLQSHAYHAPITRRASRNWSRSHTHLCFIGGVLPTARRLWILFFSRTCFTQLLVLANWIPVWVVTEQAEQLRFFVLRYFSYQ